MEELALKDLKASRVRLIYMISTSFVRVLAKLWNHTFYVYGFFFVFFLNMICVHYHCGNCGSLPMVFSHYRRFAIHDYESIIINHRVEEKQLVRNHDSCSVSLVKEKIETWSYVTLSINIINVHLHSETHEPCISNQIIDRIKLSTILWITSL